MQVLIARPFFTVDPKIVVASVDEPTPTVITLQATTTMQGSSGFGVTLAGYSIVSQVVQGGDNSIIDLTLSDRVYDEDAFSVVYSPGNWTDQRTPPIPLKSLSIVVNNTTTTDRGAPTLDAASSYWTLQAASSIYLDFGQALSSVGLTGLTIKKDAVAETLTGIEIVRGDARKARVGITSTLVGTEAITVDIDVTNDIKNAANLEAATVTGATINEVE